MKKRNLRSYTISTCLVLGLLLTGCAGTEPVPTEGAVATETVAENSTVESNVVTIDYSAGVSDDAVTESITVDGMTDIIIDSHNIEEITGAEYGDQYIARDTVSVSYNAGNKTGLLPQTVSKDFEFYMNKDTSEWEMLNDTTTACAVNNEALPGTSWKYEAIDANSLELLFGDEVQDGESGTLYIHFLKRVGVFSFNLTNENNTSSERFFTAVTTNGKLNWISDNENIEKSFSITGGSVTDSGDLNFDVNVDQNTLSMSFGTDVVQVSEAEYDTALGLEVDESKVYMDELPVFEVTSTSITGDEWNTNIGLFADNVSPELTWDAYEGATQYAVFMIDDTTSNNWFHWYALTNATHLDEGAYTDQKTDYAGPYPPETHNYDVYVVALKDVPTDVAIILDTPGGDVFQRLNDLNTASDGSIGNVLAYGHIEADYVPDDDYYGYR